MNKSMLRENTNSSIDTKNIDVIIFDLDGTLIDSGKDLAISVNYSLDFFKFPKIPEETVISFIGNGVEKLLERSVNLSTNSSVSFYDNNLAKQFTEVFLKHYNTHLLDNTVLYPNVIKTLTYFKEKGKKLAIITNKTKEPTLKILRGLNLISFFDLVIGGDEVKNKKPHPEAINIVLQNFSLKPENAIIVGDHYTDIEAAKNANIFSCFVTYGLGNLNSSEPTFIIDDIFELTSYL